MIFVKLVIDNFGVYRDRNEFELRPNNQGDENRPIVLFGGKNGAGKTTILEAIRLCLYGRTALGNRVRYKDYEKHIENRIHRHPNVEKSNEARIRLIFEHTHAGTRSIYDAVRYWNVERETLKEEISIYKDGEILQDIPQDYWDDFLRDLIPPGVADLFFFDGEQIQALANDDTESEALADAIRGLLKLDLVNRLQSDLTVYLHRQKNKDHSALEKKISRVHQELKSIEESITKARQERAHYMTQLDRANKRIEDARQALLKEGAGFITERDELVERQEELQTLIMETKNKLQDLAGELLPFALVPEWSHRLRERLEIEEATKQDRITRDTLDLKADEILNILSSSDFRSELKETVSAKTWKQLSEKIVKLIRPKTSDDDLVIRHRISDQTRHILYNWIDESQDQTPHNLNQLTAQLERLETERSEISTALERVPDELIANPLLEQFQQSSQRVGTLEEQISEIDLQIHRLKLRDQELDRERQKLQKELSEAQGIDAKVKRAAKTQVILEDYLERITSEKVQELESTFVDYFNRLARKKQLVQSVEIDPQTFEVTLYGDNKSHIPKSDLSAGEKQLYATSLLWALRSVSGRVLPLIMDTPMGRLDKDHRLAILDDFLPFAAHQVIVLSTDSEIDQDAYHRIEDTVSHAYRLMFDENEGLTRPVSGYFGEEVEVVQ